MPRPRVQVVREPEQLAALASPVRLRLLAAAASSTPLSVAELASQVGMAPASLYYHVQALVAAGLLRRRGRRRAGKRWEVLYGAAAGGVVADPLRRSPAFLRALGRVYGAVLREASRSIARALADEGREGAGPRRATAVRHDRVRLRPDDRAELDARLEQLHAFLRAADDPAGEAYAVATVLSRVPRTTRKGRSSEGA